MHYAKSCMRDELREWKPTARKKAPESIFIFLLFFGTNLLTVSANQAAIMQISHVVGCIARFSGGGSTIHQNTPSTTKTVRFLALTNQSRSNISSESMIDKCHRDVRLLSPRLILQKHGFLICFPGVKPFSSSRHIAFSPYIFPHQSQLSSPYRRNKIFYYLDSLKRSYMLRFFGVRLWSHKYCFISNALNVEDTKDHN